MTRPNIILFGVGHSGTTVVTNAIAALGWDANADGDPWSECPHVRSVNDTIIAGRAASTAAVIRGLRAPWVIKDPRFVFTLRSWTEAAPDAVLLWLRRQREDVVASYCRRGETTGDGEPGMYGRAVKELEHYAEEQFNQWPGPKIALSFEAILRATSIFRT